MEKYLIFVLSNTAGKSEEKTVCSTSNPENITAIQEPTGDKSTKVKMP